MAKEYIIKDDIIKTINKKHSSNYQRYKNNWSKSLLQIGSKKEVQKQNASTISQINVDYYVKGSRSFFTIFDKIFTKCPVYALFLNRVYIHFFHFGTFKITKNRPNLDPCSALLCFFSGVKNGRDPCRSNYRWLNCVQ